MDQRTYQQEILKLTNPTGIRLPENLVIKTIDDDHNMN